METKKVSDSEDKLSRYIEKNEIVGSYRGELAAIIIDLHAASSPNRIQAFHSGQAKTMTTKYCTRCIDVRTNCFQRGNSFDVHRNRASKVFGDNAKPMFLDFRKVPFKITSYDSLNWMKDEVTG